MERGSVRKATACRRSPVDTRPRPTRGAPCRCPPHRQGFFNAGCSASVIMGCRRRLPISIVAPSAIIAAGLQTRGRQSGTMSGDRFAAPDWSTCATLHLTRSRNRGSRGQAVRPRSAPCSRSGAHSVCYRHTRRLSKRPREAFLNKPTILTSFGTMHATRSGLREGGVALHGDMATRSAKTPANNVAEARGKCYPKWSLPQQGQSRHAAALFCRPAARRHISRLIGRTGW